MKIDLHNHTNHSDGVYSPKELVEAALKNNVDVFALTDHDSVFGCDEIAKIAKENNIFVIKGMELSTEYKGESIHIVCLFKHNIVPKEMVEFSYSNLERRKERAIEMMNNIHKFYGLNIDIEELLEENEVITRANMLRNVAKHNNLSLEEASFYVSKNSKAYIPSTKMTVEEGLKLAKNSGCITIFAHPCLVKEEYIDEILNYGFDGIEARYPSLKNNEEKFMSLASKYNLFISAGSDCHGDNTHAMIGTSTLNLEEFLPILKKLEIEELKKWK